MKILDENGALYLWQKLKTYITGLLSNKVDKVEGKGLSTNDLTDELVTKINNAGDSSFTGNYNDLTNKPDLTIYAKTTDVETKINTAVANVNKKQVVTSTNEMTDANTIYLLANQGSGNNVYDEYIIVDGKAEKIGTTDVDLTNYVKTTDIVAITNAEIDEITAS